MSNLYTFGLQYPDCVEELDVTADSYEAARREAQRVAGEDYQPGWTLIDLPQGGSSGLVSVFRVRSPR